jgi:hypothetical protein
MRKSSIRRWAMSKTITESGLNFIADNAFHIEKSPAYIRLGDSVKSVELIRAKENKLLFIEAKSSFPNPNNLTPNSIKRNKTGAELFQEEISDICDKFTHSLNLYSAINVGVIADGFPPDFNPSDKVSLIFILVITGFEQTWCDEIQKALTIQIRNTACMSKIWKPEIAVMNDKTAINRKIITAS